MSVCQGGKQEQLTGAPEGASLQAGGVENGSKPKRAVIVSVVFLFCRLWVLSGSKGLKVINEILDLKRKHLWPWELVFYMCKAPNGQEKPEVL